MEFKDLLAKFTAAVESGDGHQLGALFAPNGVYHDGFYGAFTGPDEIANMLEKHFYGAAKDFRWEMQNPVFDGRFGYARYVFSYTSTVPEAKGKRVVFEGMSQFEVEDGRILNYAENFDTGIALAQIDFAPDRMARFLSKQADAVRDRNGDHIA